MSDWVSQVAEGESTNAQERGGAEREEGLLEEPEVILSMVVITQRHGDTEECALTPSPSPKERGSAPCLRASV